MKELLYNNLVFIFICIIVLAISCCPVEKPEYDGPKVDRPIEAADFRSAGESVKKLEFEGHEYIIYTSIVYGGHSAAIVHSESCHNPSHEQNQEKKNDYLGW